MSINVKYGLADDPEIDLDNPIFVYYINIDGLPSQRVDELISGVRKNWNFSNVVTWIVPRREGETKIECVYDGRVKERSEELKELIEELNEKIDSITNANDFDEFKIIVRDWRLKALLK